MTLTLAALLLKMAIAAAIVVIVSVIAERARPFLAAMVATLPVSAGPALSFLALDHDDDFMRAALLASMLANIALCGFLVGYVRLAQRRALPVALGGAFTLWVVAGALLRPLPWTLGAASLVTVLVFGVVVRLLAPYRRVASPAAPPRSRHALVLRAGGVALLVALVSFAGAHLGPFVAGFLSVFPIVLSSLVVILHPRIGGTATAALIATTAMGLAGFGAALATAAAMVPVAGRFWALGTGLVVAIVWNGALTLSRLRRPDQA